MDSTSLASQLFGIKQARKIDVPRSTSQDFLLAAAALLMLLLGLPHCLLQHIVIIFAGYSELNL